MQRRFKVSGDVRLGRSMWVSQELIYRALNVHGLRALPREVSAGLLTTGRCLCLGPPSARDARGASPPRIISGRPAEFGEGAVRGHWEGDVIVGVASWGIGTLTERPWAPSCCTCPASAARVSPRSKIRFSSPLCG